MQRDLVFATVTGRPIDPGNFLRTWHQILAKAGLEKRPLHEARHSAASLLLSEGVPLKIVQETLGHSTIALTADLYGHLMPDDKDKAAEAMDRALGGPLWDPLAVNLAVKQRRRQPLDAPKTL